jgi:rhomboid family GlyGly-CTERM serine protease
MRRGSAIILPSIVLLVLALELFAPGEMLEYRRTLAFREPWRLLTGHFTHLSLLHALLNGVALLLIGRLFWDRLRIIEVVTLLAASSILISLAFWATMTSLHWYRGLSGALHSVFFAGCVVWIATTRERGRWLPAAALAAGALKVLLEQPWDSSFPIREWLGGAVVPQAHLIGALVGIAAGLAMAKRRRQHEPEQEQLEA